MPMPQTPWRQKWQQASFRGVPFFVEGSSQAGGRRVALHEYPKRDTPYAEDMGRAAKRFPVSGYLIGPDYLDDKDALIEALEKAGPGMLRLPVPYKLQDVEVMVASFSVTESRERGGFCTVEMDFLEYGDPAYRKTSSSPEAINSSARGVEQSVAGDATRSTGTEAAPYLKLYDSVRGGEAPL